MPQHFVAGRGIQQFFNDFRFERARSGVGAGLDGLFVVVDESVPPEASSGDLLFRGPHRLESRLGDAERSVTESQGFGVAVALMTRPSGRHRSVRHVGIHHERRPAGAVRGNHPVQQEISCLIHV